MLRVTDSFQALRRLGYEYVLMEEEPEVPETTDTRFVDLLPELANGPAKARKIAFERLYKHQLESLEALSTRFGSECCF